MKHVLQMQEISLLPKYTEGILSVVLFMYVHNEWAWDFISTMQNA
jgi:hypothetical protein